MSQTLINGTAYEIEKGNCLVGGTSYVIDHGNTLVDGSQYKIEFSQGHSFDWGVDGVSVSGTKWFSTLQAFCQEATEDEIARDIPIGGWKRMTLTDAYLGIQEWEVMVVGVNHDAPNSITFMSRHQSVSTLAWRNTLTTSPRYNNSQLRTYVNQIYDLFPDRDALKKRDVPYVSKYTNNTPTIATVSDYFWVPSFTELGLTNSSQWVVPTEGTAYPQFTDNNSRRMRDPTTTEASPSYYSYWTRTVAKYSSYNGAIVINANGSFGVFTFTTSNAVREGFPFCFMIG